METVCFIGLTAHNGNYNRLSVSTAHRLVRYAEHGDITLRLCL